MDQLVGRDAISGQPLVIQLGTGSGPAEEALREMVIQDFDAGNALALIDFDGRICDAVFAHAVRAGKPKSFLHCDLGDSEHPLGLNLLECQDAENKDEKARIVSRAEAVFRRTWTSNPPEGSAWRPTAQLLRSSLYALVENPGRTVADIPAFLISPTFRREILKAVSDEPILAFWAYFESLKAFQQHASVASILNQLDELLTRRLVFKIVAQQRTTVDFRQVVESAKSLLLQAPSSVDRPSVDLLGRVAVALILNAVDAAVPKPQRFVIYSLEYERLDLESRN